MNSRDDADRIIERLRLALEGDARRNPLPIGFSTTVAANMEDRPSVGFRRFAAMLAGFAATMALAIVVVVVPLSLSRLGMTPGPSSLGPSDRPSLAATSSATAGGPSPPITADASVPALTEVEAVEAARNVVNRADMGVVDIEAGPAGDVLPPEAFGWADVPSDDTWVWFITLSDAGPPLGQEGAFVVLDYFDGTVYGVQNWES
jgi:hypothetical protein